MVHIQLQRWQISTGCDFLCKFLRFRVLISGPLDETYQLKRIQNKIVYEMVCHDSSLLILCTMIRQELYQRICARWSDWLRGSGQMFSWKFKISNPHHLRPTECHMPRVILLESWNKVKLRQLRVESVQGTGQPPRLLPLEPALSVTGTWCH